MKIEHLLGPSRSQELVDRVVARVEEAREALVFDYAGDLVLPRGYERGILVHPREWEEDRALMEAAVGTGVDLIVLHRPRSGYPKPERSWQPPWKEFLHALPDSQTVFLVVNGFRTKELDPVPVYEPWASLADAAVVLDYDAR